MDDLKSTTFSGSLDGRISPNEKKKINCNMKSSTNVWCADHWSEQYLTEYHILEDWRKQSSTQNIPVEDWKKKCYPNYSHNVDDIKNQISHKLLPNLRVWESVRCESGVNDGMQLKAGTCFGHGISMIIQRGNAASPLGTLAIEVANTFKFKVMSYNVLAQYLLECHPYLYRECQPNNLKQEVRASKLFKEITVLSPDILCLQEVQVSHLDSFNSKFEELGYLGVFKQKTGCKQDGCAVYFRRSLFKLQDHVCVEFYQPDLPILNRDNIGIIVKLIPHNRPDSAIIVATTHLLYNPKRTDVRLAQIQVFLAEIDRFAYKGEEYGYFPIILTGDFNSQPDSAVIRLLDDGCVRASPFRDFSDWQKIGITNNCQHLSVYLKTKLGQSTNFSDIKIHNSEYSLASHKVNEARDQSTTDQFSDVFNSPEIEHSLNLKSVYDKCKANGANEATTFQDYWVTVDYIYYSCDSTLRLMERLHLPSVTECETLGCLPNDVYGSDHLALAATFELI